MSMFPVVDVAVKGTRGKAKVRALLDTGFSDFLCLPTETAVQLGLELAGRTPVEFADGTRKEQLSSKAKFALRGKREPWKSSLPTATKLSSAWSYCRAAES
jgi:predicted aspartyl protease